MSQRFHCLRQHRRRDHRRHRQHPCRLFFSACSRTRGVAATVVGPRAGGGKTLGAGDHDHLDAAALSDSKRMEMTAIRLPLRAARYPSFVASESPATIYPPLLHVHPFARKFLNVSTKTPLALSHLTDVSRHHVNHFACCSHPSTLDCIFLLHDTVRNGWLQAIST